MILRAELKIRYGRVNAFSRAFPAVLEAMEGQGWKLLGGYQTILGDFSKVLHVWEIPDANAVPEGLFAVLADKEFAKATKPIAELVEHEQIELMVPMPYSPGAEAS